MQDHQNSYNQTENQTSKSGFFGGFASTALLIWDFLKIVLLAVIIIVPIRYFVFKPFVVSGSSMEPNFQNGEYLIIDELTYHFKEPRRGQVVVLKYPKDRKQYFIKRIIGLPGEKVEIDNGKVKVYNDSSASGVTLNEDYLPNNGLTYPHDTTIIGGKKTIALKEGEYFVLGDNRLASSDSRDWGVLNRDDIIGKVFLRALPLTEFDIYTSAPEYSI